MDSIQLVLKYSVYDYIQALRCHAKNNRIASILWWEGYILFLLIVIVKASSPFNAYDFLFLAIAIYGLTYQYTILPILGRYRFHKQRHLQGDLNVEIAGNCVFESNTYFESKWKKFHNLVVSDKSILLYISAYAFIMFPRRLCSEEQYENIKVALSNLEFHHKKQYKQNIAFKIVSRIIIIVLFVFTLLIYLINKKYILN